MLQVFSSFKSKCSMERQSLDIPNDVDFFLVKKQIRILSQIPIAKLLQRLIHSFVHKCKVVEIRIVRIAKG